MANTSKLQRRDRLKAGLFALGVCAAVSGCVSVPADEVAFTGGGSAPGVADARGTARNMNVPEPATYPALGRDTDRPYGLVASDLVNALAQIDGLMTGDAVIRIPPARTPFAQALESALIDRLFDVERIADRTGKGVLMNSILPTRVAVDGRDDLGEYTFIVAIDRIAIKRTYRVGERFVAPISSLFVRGAEPAEIELNDRVFLRNAGSRS